MTIYDLLKYFLSALFFSYFLFPVFIKLLERKKILDAPDKRKIHLTNTPSMGGIPIFLGAAFALLVWLPYEASFNYKYLFGALTITFVIGLRDDLIPLKPHFKLLSQLIPAAMVIYLGDIQLQSLYELAVVQFPDPLIWIITVFVIIVITNSINLIDGLDGLAGAISFVTLSTLGIWFYLTGHTYLSFIIFSFGGAIISFLLFNWEPSKIFMGDTGALLLGFLQACVVILFININSQLPASSIYKFEASISSAICIMIIPLLDTLRVFVLRVSKSQSPFTADNNHIHHLLIKLGFRHRHAVLILIGVNLVFIGLACLLNNQSDLIVLPTATILALLIIGVMSFYLSKSKTKEAGVK